MALFDFLKKRYVPEQGDEECNVNVYEDVAGTFEAVCSTHGVLVEAASEAEAAKAHHKHRTQIAMAS